MAIYRSEISQMMFVIGDSEPITETTTLVEEIVRSQVIEMLVQATSQASRRNSKSISVEDLIFLIRHDRAKVNRLRTYLSWKDVRKNAKDTDGGADGTELLEDGAQPESKLKYKKARVGLPWDLQSMFTEQVPEREDEEDEEETEANFATMQRLKNADERTRTMSKDEYVHWSECRQASFTYRKSKRFREWTHMSQLTESRPSDDIVDILGFLTFEIVASITEEALKVKLREEGGMIDDEKKRGEEVKQGDDAQGTPLVINNNTTTTTTTTAIAEDPKTDNHLPLVDNNSSSTTTTTNPEDSLSSPSGGGTLFDMPVEGRKPLNVKHIEEAYRRLLVPTRSSTAMRLGQGGRFKTKNVLI